MNEIRITDRIFHPEGEYSIVDREDGVRVLRVEFRGYELVERPDGIQRIDADLNALKAQIEEAERRLNEA